MLSHDIDIKNPLKNSQKVNSQQISHYEGLGLKIGLNDKSVHQKSGIKIIDKYHQFNRGLI